MFDVVLENIKKLLKSRLFPITLIYLALFFVVIHRLFVLQIVEGPEIVTKTELKYTENREIKSTRGNIYDRKGKLLASNELSYSVIMEDITQIESNEQKNAIIYQLIKIIEENGDTLDNKFYIIQNDKKEFEFTIKDPTKFKENAYALIKDDEKYKDVPKNATAEDVYEFLRKGTGDNYTHMFDISDEYSVEDTLKIMGIRYALFCNYPKYYPITIASDISPKTVAAIMENSADMPGVEIQQQTRRVYHDSIYFAHILGYTGRINAEELNKFNNGTEKYNPTDIIGKLGLEQKFEDELGGIKGNETVSVSSSGKVIEVVDRVDPVAGNDIYLTIDSDLQKAVYHILENEIAGIILGKLRPDLDYGSKGTSADKINIPIYEVYYALINNNIIDTTSFQDEDATDLEKQTYRKYEARLNEVFHNLDSLLDTGSSVPNDKAGDMEEYLNDFYSALLSEKILLKDSIPQDDVTYNDYKNNKISLSKFLQYAIANNWVDLSQLEIGDEYYSSEELYQKLVAYTKEILIHDDKFNKNIYRDLVFSYKLSGTEICLLLFDQGVLEYNEEEIHQLSSGSISAYEFIRGKIKSLAITPAMLALEPCSGSVVITDVNTGDVLALVSYPSYDNNLLANKVNAEYYAKLQSDKSLPQINRAVMQRTAPGSTFKMVSAVAALEEGITNPSELIRDLGIFDKTDRPAKCHVYPSTHGSVNIVDALKVSCNYYFYEMGYRLSIDGTGQFSNKLGLERLAKYATLFGLNEPSGIELDEALPEISDTDSVRSAIGQGSNDYTTIQLARYITTLANRGTCYDLTLIDSIVDKDGNMVKDNHAKVKNDLTSFQATTWDSVWEGMYSVANADHGSVTSVFKDLGVTVAGKTGTSQINKSHPNNALFVSFAPYENPQISVTAVIPNGYTSHNAAELTKNIYKLYFKLDNTENIVDNEANIPETIDSALSE